MKKDKEKNHEEKKPTEELDNINDKNNALIIAGLTLANKLLSSDTKSDKVSDLDFSKLINKIEKAIEK